MFSDDGIKTFILNKFLPILNKLINYYLKIFNISIYLELTSDYNYTMKSSNGLADDYEGLSGGQQQRINLAILFAQTDLIKIIGNFKTNVLFLDEFIDGAIDHEGLMDTLKIMKQISIRDNKAIVFISHRLDSNLIRDIDNFYMANMVDNDFSEFLKVNSEDVMQIINQN
jgi:DNA repair exonuclease SbcCD ATPase subunit